MPLAIKRAQVLLCPPLLAVAVAACGGNASTSGFAGEDRQVAQTIANLQSDARAGSQQKVCANDLASALVARLSSARGGCEQVIKDQLAEIDSFEASVQAVQVAGAGAGATATARVKSIFAGKSRPATVTLVKEGGRWKISGLQ